MASPGKRALRAVARWLLPQRLRARLGSAGSSASSPGSAEYASRVAAERDIFAGQLQVHELPEIFHYWSNRYLRPINESFGFSHPEHFFQVWLARAYDRVKQARPADTLRFISLGSGNCDAEVRIAKGLVESNRPDFLLECLDINEAMLSRGRALAQAEGVPGQVRPVQGDFNDWQPPHRYDAVLANQSLHHVVALESLFTAVSRAIGTDGDFIVSDMIGRNGHMRWPEALAIVQEFWRELPPAYRYNRQLQRQEDLFMDWDCSVEGFEGIRAQDILPLLIQRFGFRFFLAYGNAIDPFIDRSFGHNFDAAAEWDRAFIDRVHARDEAEILAGRIKPTHMMAVLCNDRSARPAIWKHLAPEFCVRPA